MADDLFTRAIADAMDELPPELAARLENMDVLVDEAHPEEPEIYGLYEGVPLTERGMDAMDAQLPDRITIYRRPLTEDFGHDPAELARQVRITVLHEIGHYFGIGEERLAELGWA